MLRWRTATALVLAPVVLGAILIGRWAVLVVILAVVALAAHELARALSPLPLPAALLAALLPILLSIPFGLEGILAGTLLSLPLTLFWLTGNPDARTLRAFLGIILMALWVGVPMAHIGLISRQADGLVLMMIAVVGPWVSDAGAYFAGRIWGRNLLFPELSPSKTVEGAIGGLLTTTLVVGYVAYTFLGSTAVEAAVAGVAVSLFSQSGDLFESILKRILDTKDLGHSLPGHGGILDRIDSLLFTAPAVYYISLFI